MKVAERSGQIGLILLVLMGVVIALALSLASRSLSDTVLSRQEQESSTAFRLAETGVEQAMNTIRTNTANPTGATMTPSGIFSGSYDIDSLTSYALYVKEGEQANLDLAGFTGNLTISWTRTGDATENRPSCAEGSGGAPAALEIMEIRGPASAPTAKFAYVDPPCNVPNNNITTVAQSASAPYLSRTTYAVVAPATAIGLRIRPLYANATISVTGTNLATQLYLIQSEAAGGDAKKEIEVKRGLDAPPSVFDFAIFSGGRIYK